MTSVHVDRVEELGDIDARVRARNKAAPVGLVCGIRSIGKTALLEQARIRSASPRRLIGRIDLELALEPEQVLDRLVNRLGAQNFPTYRKAYGATKPVQPTQNMGDVTLSGDAILSISIDGISQRASNTRHLTGPFIDDLRRVRGGRPLLLFDHFDRCPSDTVRSWLREDLLRDMADVADVLVLVATESAPWGSHGKETWIDGVSPFVIKLKPFEVNDILDWMDQLGLTRNRVLADFLVRVQKGVPGPISHELHVYVQSGGTGSA